MRRFLEQQRNRIWMKALYSSAIICLFLYIIIRTFSFDFPMSWREELFFLFQNHVCRVLPDGSSDNEQRCHFQVFPANETIQESWLTNEEVLPMYYLFLGKNSVCIQPCLSCLKTGSALSLSIAPIK
jgi:hypothetical protein